MTGWILAVVALAAVGLWALTRTRKAPTRGPVTRRGPAARPGKSPAPADQASPADQLVAAHRAGNIWGVQVGCPPGQGCAAVQEIRDTKFDLDRAPRLPLRGCDAVHCRCRYVVLKERRRRDVLPPDTEDRRNTGKVRWDIHKS